MKFLIILFSLCCMSLYGQRKENGIQFINFLLVKKEYNSSYNYFSEEMKTQISLPVLQQTVEQIKGQLGNFKKIIEVNNDNKNIYLYYSEFEKMKLDIQVTFNDENKIIGFFFVPHKIFDDKGSKNTLNISSGDIELKGTALFPVENNKKKLVIFIHGSGPEDRDETIGENKPFKDISEYLLKNGIASYRYDKRTFSNPETFNESSTAEEEVINDAVSVVNFFEKNEKYNDYKIILAGHSFGGYLLPKIYEKSLNVSKLIFLAANARPLQNIIIEQLEYLHKIDSSNISNEAIKTVKKQVDFLRSKNFNLTSKNSDLPLNLSAKYWKYLLNYDPFKYIKQISVPILFAQGGKDYQVTEKDFNLWKSELRNSNTVIFKFYPKLNHIFTNNKDIPSPKDYEIKENINEDFLNDVKEFILK